MTYLNVAERLLTWLDVERTLKQLTQLWTHLPEGVHAIECYHDGVDISHSATEDAVKNWRNQTQHRATQRAGRDHIFADYRLRVASVIRDYGMFERDEAPDDSRTHHN